MLYPVNSKSADTKKIKKSINKKVKSLKCDSCVGDQEGCGPILKRHPSELSWEENRKAFIESFEKSLSEENVKEAECFGVQGIVDIIESLKVPLALVVNLLGHFKQI